METIDMDISFYPNYMVNDSNKKKYDIEIGFTKSGCRDCSISKKQDKVKGHVAIDFETLESFYDREDYQQYGKHLSECLFSDPAVLEIFKQALKSTTVNANSIPLRIRLFILPKLIKLHNLHWETMVDPASFSKNPEFLLSTDRNLYFFRYFTSAEWKPVPLLPQEGKLRTLVFVSNPEDAEGYEFEPIDAQKIMIPIKTGLNDIDEVKYSLDSNGNATIEDLIRNLNQGFNILYLICPAITQENKTYLFFEKNDGSADKIRGKTLITRLKQLIKKPFLIIISSCHNKKNNRYCNISQTHFGLAQRLISSGFPVVLSIQGKMSNDSTSAFLSTFFEQLKKFDQIDKAVADARASINNKYDRLMPILYMRIKSGRIWYKKGFATNPKDTWEILLKYIGVEYFSDQKKCVPILGPGLSENILGSRRQIAQDWANTYNFPLTPYQQDQLHLVAHYMSVAHRDPNEIKSIDFLNYIFEKLKERFKKTLEENPLVLKKLEKQFKKSPGNAINTFICDDIPAETNPHKILANLPSQIYITTQFTDLLKKALAETGRKPVRRYDIWSSKIDDKDYRLAITEKRPLIFHLFGHITKPDDLILSEDELFDLMVNSAKDIDNIDSLVAKSVMDNCILILGFHLYDWTFKVLVRTLLKRDNSAQRRKGLPIIAVQIDPEDGQILDAYGARNYLKKYFKKILDVDKIMIYWGKPEAFLNELYDKLEERGLLWTQQKK